MVEQRIVLLDLLEMCVPCTTVLWCHGSRSHSSPTQLPEWAKQLLEQQKQATGVKLKHLQNELAGLSSKVTKKQRIQSFVLRGTRNNMSSTKTSWRKSTRLSNRLMPMSRPPS